MTNWRERLESNVPAARFWGGRRVRVVDGTTGSMPDTIPNQGAYPQPSGQKAGCGFPRLKVVGLFSLASGAMLRAVPGPVRLSEVALVRQLWGHLTPGEVVLADRGFLLLWLLGRAAAVGPRLGHAVAPGPARQLAGRPAPGLPSGWSLGLSPAVALGC